MPKPHVSVYRRIQLARFLIANKFSRAGKMRFKEGKILDYGCDVSQIKTNPKIYITTGCPSCDRPYYTESIRQPYNFPRPPTKEEMGRVLEELEA